MKVASTMVHGAERHLIAALGSAKTSFPMFFPQGNRTVRRHRRNAEFTILKLLVCCLTFLSGCGLTDWAHHGFKVGPEYCRPGASVSDDWIDADADGVTGTVSVDPQWWSTLNDPVLDRSG